MAKSTIEPHIMYLTSLKIEIGGALSLLSASNARNGHVKIPRRRYIFRDTDLANRFRSGNDFQGHSRSSAVTVWLII